MKKYFLFLPLMALVFACNSKSSETNEPETSSSAETPSKATTKNEALNAVYEQYSQLTEALAKTDNKQSRINANAISAGANNADKKEVAAAADKIAASEDIEVQRKSFEELSNALINWVKQAGISNGSIYIAHCPMAFNDKGASWLTSTKEIKNPYFGNKMLTCGAITETIQ